jgi:hypothetical protein
MSRSYLSTPSPRSVTDKIDDYSSCKLICIDPTSDEESDEGTFGLSRIGVSRKKFRSHCSHLGCKESATIKEGSNMFCRVHAKSQCSFPGCHYKSVYGETLCHRHGGHGFCTVQGCIKPASSKGSDRCHMHLLGNGCVVFGCAALAQRGFNVCCRHGGGVRCLVKGCFKYCRSQGLCTNHRRVPIGDLDLSEETMLRLGKPLLDHLKQTAKINNYSLRSPAPELNQTEITNALDMLGDFGEGFFQYEEETEIYGDDGVRVVVPEGYYFFSRSD